MILRHLTTIRKLPLILESGYLIPADKPGKMDDKLVSFEVYTGSEELIKCYAEQKKVSKEDIIPLFFDGQKMVNEGINLVKKVYGNAYSKSELQVFIGKTFTHKGNQYDVPGIITQEEYESIGEYLFVDSRVPLRFLTAETKRNLGVD